LDKIKNLMSSEKSHKMKKIETKSQIDRKST